jgi:hypothetical protein
MRNTRGLRPFQKGKSGNPGGRPKSLQDIRERLHKMYGADALDLLQRLDAISKLPGVKNARLRLAAIELLLSYHSGRPRQAVDVSDNCGPLLIMPPGSRLPDFGNPPLKTDQEETQQG